MNPVKRLLLGSGRLSDELRQQLAAERIVFAEERLTGSVRYRNYRDHRTSLGNEIEGMAGAVVLTAGRLVVWVSRGPHSGKHIDVPLVNRRPVGVDVSADRPGRIVFGYDPARFHADRSGWVEVHLKTPSAADLARRLT